MTIELSELIKKINPAVVKAARAEAEHLIYRIKIEEDYKDYYEAAQIKQTNTNWLKHDDLKKELGL